MNQESRYRHELKYDIDYSAYLALRSRIRAVMKPDEHTGENGKYLIRSIYFDNYTDKALREKIDGAAKREKFRIRWYNDDLSFVTLEKKMKVNNLTRKIDARWSETELRKFIAGDYSFMMSHPAELTRELYVKMQTQQLKPRVVVSYTREPYIFTAGNVRVTFDNEIRSSLFSSDFLSAPDIEVTEEPGHTILEVKYDDFLPEIISCLIQSDDCRQTAFSKYAAARRYG